MPEPLFPDAVAVVCTLLDGSSLGVTIVRKIPSPRPAEFVLVRRTGGVRLNLVTDGAQIVLESWAGSSTRCHEIAQAARQALRAGRGAVVAGTVVGPVDELSGPGDLPDPTSDQPRVRQTFTVGVRGS